MIRESLSGLPLAPFAVGALLMFVAVFVGVSVWAMTRRASQVARWSEMPLADGAAVSDGRGCGRCEECDCNQPKTISIGRAHASRDR